MAGHITLIQLEQHRASESPVEPAIPMERLKLRRPDRRQVTCRAVEIEQLAGADHPARAIWELSGRLDLSGFAGALRTQRDQGGRAAWDPRLLAAIWIWAYSEGISSAREIERQMDYRPELEWLCGMEVVNHHTLSDFRVCHAEALEQIFTQVLAVLSQAGLIDLQQVAVDGTRLRSQAATSSERRRGTIEKHLEQARAVVSERAADIGAGFEAKFFIYDEAGDTYACPANKTLAYRRASSKRGGRYRQYQAQERPQNGPSRALEAPQRSARLRRGHTRLRCHRKLPPPTPSRQ